MRWFSPIRYKLLRCSRSRSSNHQQCMIAYLCNPQPSTPHMHCSSEEKKLKLKEKELKIFYEKKWSLCVTSSSMYTDHFRLFRGAAETWGLRRLPECKLVARSLACTQDVDKYDSNTWRKRKKKFNIVITSFFPIYDEEKKLLYFPSAITPQQVNFFRFVRGASCLINNFFGEGVGGLV